MPPPWSLLILALSAPLAGGFVLHLETDCLLSADGGLLQPSWTLFFNKMPFTCFDFQAKGFVPCGLGASPLWGYYLGFPVADWLTNTSLQLPEDTTQQCQLRGQALWAQTGDRRTAPKVLISPVTPQNTPDPIMLACMVWGFYPGDVNITWLWNGEPVKDRLEPPRVTSNGDWSYQAQLTLPVDPQKGGSYTCSVHHSSLKAPLTAEWAPGVS
ncbi:PREDICTED: class II histocompatibility antigen, M beta 1 chain [Thamnophis sirtalis]|uniref:Class II histocompatibility antigen, M beta 1 chain n=1 Tax=Thamnophis sirtalis TaxID=35019 RepID=A0A6I9YV32_9SAUR|nr:PREDICTED: class II histocompatibility antigen, M beta 1 chain [Thamnophis sirtalis]